MFRSALALLPRGYTLPESDWQRRHSLLLWVLLAHVPLLALFGLVAQRPWYDTAIAAGVPALTALAGRLLRSRRRLASVIVTFGFAGCSVALVAITGGAIEAHFHFFIIIGFIALYQDWVPFLFNVGFTVLSHGIGSGWQQTLIFNHSQGQANPWLWSAIHGIAVLCACAGMVIFWRVTEDQQHEKDALSRELAEAEIGRRKFTSDLLVNLARRNQSMLHRQLEIINQLEESETDPDALSELFRLDHITTRVRRNAESLLVLSGEQPPRVWGEPVPLNDVVRAAIAETEDLGRVVHEVDDHVSVNGNAVTDLTHLLAELTENAVRFSPPGAPVTLRSRPHRAQPGGHVITVEDWGVGMTPEDLAAANALFAEPPDVDLAVHQRLGFHVVARLAARHGVRVSLNPTPGSGTTAVVELPAPLFGVSGRTAESTGGERLPSRAPGAHANGFRPRTVLPPAVAAEDAPVDTLSDNASTVTLEALRPRERVDAHWPGWWEGDEQDGPPNGFAGFSDGGRADIGALPTRRPTSDLRPAPRPRPAADDDPAGGLRRRVPQASLAPALRREGDPTWAPEPEDAPRIDPAAAGALSRYQANRQAAHEEIDRGALQ